MQGLLEAQSRDLVVLVKYLLLLLLETAETNQEGAVSVMDVMLLVLFVGRDNVIMSDGLMVAVCSLVGGVFHLRAVRGFAA